MMAVKVHTTAVAVVPPAAIWRHIQAIRCFRDKSFVRWPPHVNLLYPFLPDETGPSPAQRTDTARRGNHFPHPDSDYAFRSLALRASRALSRVAPFRVRLERLRTFRHSARSLTVWVDPVMIPEPAERGPGSGFGCSGRGDGGRGSCGGHGGLDEVQRLLEREFPECQDLSLDEGRGIDGFVPHLSLGQLRDESELEALQAAWQPVEFLVDSVQLISRRGYLSPFTIRFHVPLGLDLPPVCHSDQIREYQQLPDAALSTSAPSVDPVNMYGAGVHRLDVPYVATMANLAGDVTTGRDRSDGEGSRLTHRFASPCLAARPGSGHGSVGPIGGRAGHKASSQSTMNVSTSPAAGDETGGGRREGVKPCQGPVDAAGDPVGAGGVSVCDGTGSDSVWWFAYGAAAAVPGSQVGALQSVAARLEGYQLTFNRQGARANLAPITGPAGTPEAGVAGGPADASATRRCSRGDEAAVSGLPAPPQGETLLSPRTSTEKPAEVLKCGALGDNGFAPVRGADAAGDGQEDVRAAGSSSSGGSGGGGSGGGVLAGPEALAAVHGVLHRVPVDWMARILLACVDAWPVEVLCWPYGRGTGDAAGTSGGDTATSSSPIAAVAFQVPPERCLAQSAAPAHGYLDALRQACDHHDIDKAFNVWLRGLPAAQDGPDRGPASGTAAAGRPQGRQSASRTGGKKAASGLPRSVMSW